MPENTKSNGVTRTEELLFSLCQRSFLRIWSYANPFKDDGKELCDVIAVFGDHIFIFFDRESNRFSQDLTNISVEWQRWKKESVDKQIKTAVGVERYLRLGRKVYLDHGGKTELPVQLPKNPKIHKIVVAHGAKDACKRFSENNIYGSIGVSYGPTDDRTEYPFLVSLQSTQKIHLFDAHNLKIILGELDTFFDFVNFISEKERAIDQYQFLSYCGEEDLLAHYFKNYDDASKAYKIGTSDKSVNGLHIGEGEWHDFVSTKAYNLRKVANRSSYLWDGLIQRTSDNFLAGLSGGNSNIFNGESAIVEMAREPRMSRRALSDNMLENIERFPSEISEENLTRLVSIMPSFYKDVKYVFLQLQPNPGMNYEEEYRVIRQRMLNVACGTLKNIYPHLSKVIGIAIEAPKHTSRISEDFLLLNCREWSSEQKIFYEEENRLLGFFKSGNMKARHFRTVDFPRSNGSSSPLKIGRNDTCPCGSGKKFKRCCYRLGSLS